MRKWLSSHGLEVIVIVAAALAGCDNSNSEENGGGGDALEVVRVVTTVSVAVDAPLAIEFNMACSLPAGADDYFELFRKSDLTEVDCSCAHGISTDLVLLTPSAPLEYDTTYVLKVRAGLPAVSGDPLAADWQGEITTEQHPGEALGIAPFDVVRHGIDMHAVAGGPYGWVAVGDEGLALVAAGGRRFVLPSGTPRALRDVAMPVPGTVFVGYGDGTPEHPEGGLLSYTQGGQRRTLVTLPDEAIVSVDAVSYLEAYAISPSRLFRYRHTVLDELFVVPEARMNDIWAFSGDALWIAGLDGLLRGDASTPWETVDDSRVYTDVTGLDADTVVALSTWTNLWVSGDSVVPVDDMNAVWNEVRWVDQNWGVMIGYGSSARPVTKLFRGTSYSIRSIDVPERLNGVSAWRDGGLERAVAVGQRGREFAYAEETDAWAGERLPKQDAAGHPIHWTDLAAGAGRHLYGLRGGGIRVYDGVTQWWDEVDGPSNLVLTQLDADGSDYLFATGKEDGGIDWYACWHDGAEWTTAWMSSMDEPRDLWGFQEMREGEPHVRLFVACDYGLVYMMGGISTPLTVIRPGETMGQHLRGVWGTTSESVWVVGENGLIAHYENPELNPVGTWSVVVPPPTTAHLSDIAGTSEEHIVAVGDGGTILSLEGSTWVPLDPTVYVLDLDFTHVWTDGPDNLWVATTDGVVIHYDGVAWSRWEVAVPNSPIRALMYGASDLWLAGDRDLLLRYAEPPDLIPLLGTD